jgi:hypothetical protein
MRPIAIQVKGFFLDFTGSLRFKLLNPMFQRDSIPGISVFPFDLPGTPGNKRLLDYFNLAEDNQYSNSEDAIIYLYGNLWIRGGLKYKWVKDHFEAEFSQVMTLYENKDKLLNTITLGTYDMLNQDGYNLFASYIKDRSLDSWAGARDIVFFPQYNPSLLNNKESLKGSPSPYTTPFDTLLPDQYVQYMNYWDYHEPNTGLPDIVNFWFRSFGSPDRTNDLVMSPGYYIKNLLTELFKANDFTTIESPDFLDIEDIAKLVLTTDKFFRMRVNLTAPGGTDTYRPLFIDFTDFIFRQSTYLPDISIVNFLNGVKNFFNLSYFFGLIDGKVEVRHNEMMLADESYTEWTHKCFLLHEKEASIIESITQKYSQSDDALYNDVKPIRDRAILPSVGTFASLPAVSSRGKICLVRDENNYYEQEYGLSGLEWKFYSHANVHYSGNGIEELETNSDTWHVGKQTDQIEGIVTDNITPLGPSGYTGKKVWRIPQGEFPGNSDRFGLKPKDAGYVRFLFYRGMQVYIDHYNYWIVGNTNPTYPYATNDEYDTQDKVIGTHSLLFNGSLGIHNKWWSKWIEFLKVSVPIKRAVTLSLDDLLSFDFKKKRMIDGLKYFVKEGDVVIGNEKGIEPAVIEFLKVAAQQ